VYYRDRTCRLVSWWEVYSPPDCQSVILEHTLHHQVLSQSLPNDFHAADVDPETFTLQQYLG